MTENANRTDSSKRIKAEFERMEPLAMVQYKLYHFEPKEDITAYELAAIIGAFGANMLKETDRYVRWPEEAMRSDDCIFRRHFKEANDTYEARGY